MYLLSHKASYLAFKRDQYHFTIQMLKFWSVLSLKTKLQKSILNLFQPIFSLKATFLSNFWQQWGHRISGIYHANLCLHDFKRKLCHIKSWKKNNSGEITGDALLKMQMRLEKRLRPTTVSYLLIMPTINPPDVCH